MNDKKKKRLRDIREHALQAFIEHGFDAQMSDIARACNIGHGTLYRDFKDKSALYEHILTLEIQRAESLWETGTLAQLTHSLFTSWSRSASLFAHVPKAKIGPLHLHYKKVDECARVFLDEEAPLWRACVFQAALMKNADAQCERIVALFSQSSEPKASTGAVQGWRL